MPKPDEAHRLTDKELATLERRIARVYREARDELDETVKAYFESFRKRDEEMKALIGQTVNGKVWTEQDYKQWRLNQIGRGERYQDLREKIAQRMTNANEVAISYVNDATPGIYSLNRNYAAYTIEKVAGDVGFTLWDESTVQRLIVEEPDLMPYYPKKKTLKRGIDLNWGKKQITKSVTSGLLQGKSVGKIATDLQARVSEMNRASAVRAARTAVTGAQNGGRMDSYKAARQKGIALQKEWMATLDGRTRHSHRRLDGEVVDYDEEFSNGCRYPGDPRGKPSEVYNCRCTLVARVKGVDTSEAKRRARNPKTGESTLIKNQTYAEWAGWKKNAGLTESEKETLFRLRKKYKTLESAMLFGTTDEMTTFSKLLEKERTSASEYDFDVFFNNQKISEKTLYSWQSEPSKQQTDAISSYSRNGYVKMNEHIRHGTFVKESMKREIEELGRFLSSCSTKETIYLERGISVGSIEKIIGSSVSGGNYRNAIGQVIKDNGFVSTTPYAGGGFGGNVICYIKAPPGTHGAYIRKYAAAENEKEFLLDKGQAFLIRNILEETDKWGDKKYKLYLEIMV